jgi:NAD(P)-dependent dehydrogenase (short-subunit alcohol dehydrogenase family)
MFTARFDPSDPERDESDYDGPRFYANAKRAQVMLAEEFARREGNGVGFHSMHPGWADTPGLEKSLPRFHRAASPLLRDAGQGADTAVWLLADPEADRHPGALWHDRRPRSAHRLRSTRGAAGDGRKLWDRLIQITAPYAEV